ncbi:hypothetical protein FMEAI12_6420001 [Parafrankia sp. Ea1.12]|nr:hypothetical protein FMEAI12_6420001 [Parafrankia sp. Ea1.12]
MAIYLEILDAYVNRTTRARAGTVPAQARRRAAGRVAQGRGGQRAAVVVLSCARPARTASHGGAAADPHR